MHRPGPIQRETFGPVVPHSQPHPFAVPDQGPQGGASGLVVPQLTNTWQHRYMPPTYSYDPVTRSASLVNNVDGDQVPHTPAGSHGPHPSVIGPSTPAQGLQSRYMAQPSEVHAGVHFPQYMPPVGDTGRQTMGPHAALPSQQSDVNTVVTLLPRDQLSFPQAETLQPVPGDPIERPTEAQSATSKSGGRRMKKLNISTVKFHALGHYPKIIRYFGPTDLYSTEWVNLT